MAAKRRGLRGAFRISTSSLALVACLACSSSEIIGSSYRPSDSSASGAGGSGAGGTGGAGGAGGTGPSSNGTNYDEPYRGQFHFSPAAMWMDTIDGVWFYGGVYHLTYDAAPYSYRQSDNGHWGHATSPDLLHWRQEPLALVPGVNVRGNPWAGSVVVDTADTAGFRSGDQPAFVAVHTATGTGTSLAYSTDLGRTWQAYTGNPVAIGDANYQMDRDPVVTWHAPSQRWVCAYWENGITFYTSPDLKAWTKAGNFNWGQLHPDLYELAVDGDTSRTKWVLQDASGAYFLGQFDGQSFVPDPGGPYSMDVGPDFYSARTSYRPTFPGSKAVQIGWIRNSGLPTAPARGDATFPVDLRLKTFPEGVRLTRTPIDDIAKIYGATRHWDGQTLAAGTNLLSGIESKTFDFELVIDDSSTQATQIHLQIANKAVPYDRSTQLLLGKPLSPLGGQLKLRVLADWSQLEVFGNDGELSYTENFGFTPTDASLSLTADGPLAIVSADFREVLRTWPGTAALSSHVVDDTAADVTYTGSWQPFTNDDTYFNQTCHVSRSADAALELTFTGTRIDWYGLVNVDLGKADVYLDGVVVAAAIDCYSAVRAPVLLFSKSGLARTFHTVRIVPTGTKNPASSGTALVHDYFIYSAER
jgi:sucrose-6-phosphate hydrolase SacC (GH32 family)